MDATGLSAFSALPLLPLLLIFWYLEKLPRREVGFTLGHGGDYALAVLYPVAVIGSVTCIAFLAGATDVSQFQWRKTLLNLLLIGVTTAIMTIVTEEGFFRGWLWASLARTGRRDGAVLAWTSVAFALWHVSAVALKTGFDIPAPQIPLYLVNAGVMGAGWGILRSHSKSVVVASVSHGIWNGLAYSLFAFGEKTGALGVRNTAVYGPEIGVVGLAVNTMFVAALWWWWRSRRRPVID